MSVARVRDETILYRMINSHEEVVYVGISSDVIRRLKEHYEKHWFRCVSRVECTTFPDRDAAAAAELKMIKELRPAYNKSGKPALESEALDLPPVIFADGREPCSVAGRRASRRKPLIELIGLSEAAELCDVDYRTIRRWIQKGRLKAVRVGPKLLKVSRADIDVMMRPLSGGSE